VGQLDNAQNVLNIQPVVPLHLNQDWNLITRSIMPVIYQSPFFRGDSTDFGLGGLQSSLLLLLQRRDPEAIGANWQLRARMTFLFPTH
jgi:hypothetical protein